MGRTSRSSEFPPPPRPPADFRPRVVVRFREDVNLAYEDNAHEQLLQRHILPWSELTEVFGPITLDRVFFSLDWPDLSRLEQAARAKNPSLPSAGFRHYFEVECPPGKSAEKLAASLERYQVVERAYVATAPMWPPAVRPEDDLPHAPAQYYLGPAPGGVDAAAAWAVAGGDGAGVEFVDIEEGWNLEHVDLPKKKIPLLSGVNRSSRGHGTSVLGIIRAEDNTIGCIGLAPAANVSVASQWRQRIRPRYNTEDALVSVANTKSRGAIVLLEAQTTDWLPMEVEDAVFLAIRVMTSLDITLIECAGNHNRDLDDYQDALGRRILKRDDGYYRDSGAIVVAASTSGLAALGPAALPPRSRCYPSNYGTRADCYAWGQHVVTTGDGGSGTGLTDYMTLPAAFGGTSAAAAIIAGVAICTQGIAFQDLGQFLSATDLRDLLTNPQFGTPSNTPPPNPAADLIGQMPDLRLIANGAGVLWP